MKHSQTLHEQLIPMLVSGIGAESYLEMGTHKNQTISKVNCEKRTGVDMNAVALNGAIMLNMTTEEFIKGHAAFNAPYDFVFIDADHDFDAIKNDFLGIWPHVSPEGLVLFHDSNPATTADTKHEACSDSWRFAQFLVWKGYECLTLPYHPGLTITRKRTLWGPVS